ncbi:MULTISPECIES: helix-turn-helix domain-containing protein [Pseudomonas]|nr:MULTISPECIES: helix-turn-helix domain-containing protein [Pseudomonas]
MLTNEQLSELNSRFESNANALISARGAGGIKPERSATGGDYEKLVNPFAGYIVCPLVPVDNTSKDHTLYPKWCLDVVEGVARLNWYRPEGDQFPLSVKKILLMLQTCKQIDKYTVGEMFDFESRQAERYVQAARIVIPQLEKVVPESLKLKIKDCIPLFDTSAQVVGIASTIDLTDDVPNVFEWKRHMAEWLEKLHHDCEMVFTKYNTREFYEADRLEILSEAIVRYPVRNPVTVKVLRVEHPMQAKALEMIRSGLSVANVARETGVHRNTVSKWKIAA